MKAQQSWAYLLNIMFMPPWLKDELGYQVFDLRVMEEPSPSSNLNMIWSPSHWKVPSWKIVKCSCQFPTLNKHGWSKSPIKTTQPTNQQNKQRNSLNSSHEHAEFSLFSDLSEWPQSLSLRLAKMPSDIWSPELWGFCLVCTGKSWENHPMIKSL